MTSFAQGDWRSEASVVLGVEGIDLDEPRRLAALDAWSKAVSPPARVNRFASVDDGVVGVVFDGVFATGHTPGNVVDRTVVAIKSALVRVGITDADGMPVHIRLTALPERPGTQPGDTDA